MKYAVFSNNPIVLPAHVRAYLKRRAAAARCKDSPTYRKEQARVRRLKRIINH